MQAEITDVTFQGSERDNVYPSGLDFQYYCQEHAPSGHEDKAYRKTQLELRGKYLIKEVELDGIPGHNRRSRKSGSSSRRPNAAPRKKEPIRDLPPDSYRNLCACCLGPIQGFGALELEDREKMELLGDQAEVGADVAVGVGANASEVKTEVPFSSMAMEGVSSSVSVSAGTSTGPDTAGTGAAVVVKLEPESSILPSAPASATHPLSPSASVPPEAGTVAVVAVEMPIVVAKAGTVVNSEANDATRAVEGAAMAIVDPNPEAQGQLLAPLCLPCSPAGQESGPAAAPAGRRLKKRIYRTS